MDDLGLNNLSLTPSSSKISQTDSGSLSTQTEADSNTGVNFSQPVVAPVLLDQSQVEQLQGEQPIISPINQTFPTQDMDINQGVQNNSYQPNQTKQFSDTTLDNSLTDLNQVLNQSTIQNLASKSETPKQNILAADNESLTIEPAINESQDIKPVNNTGGVNINYNSEVTSIPRAPNVSVSYHDPNINNQNNASTHHINKKTTIGGLLKLMVLLIIPLIAVGATSIILVGNAKEKTYQQEKEILVSVPMKNVNWQDLGNVFEPVISIPVRTLSSFENWEFLIDSGAVISSLPSDWAEKTGQDLAFLKRSTFRGFGGKTSFAYQGEMTVKLGDEEISLPVVFTEASGTKSLLGRKGFFENYSLYFNHKDKQIEIRK